MSPWFAKEAATFVADSKKYCCKLYLLCLRLNKWPVKPPLANPTAETAIHLSILDKCLAYSCAAKKRFPLSRFHFLQKYLMRDMIFTRLPILGARLVRLFGREGPSFWEAKMYLEVVSCSTRLSSSWWWWPDIQGGRFLLSLLRPGLMFFPFFCLQNVSLTYGPG